MLTRLQEARRRARASPRTIPRLSEQLLLQIRLAQRPADDVHKRPGSTRALAMNLAGNRLLSRADLALNQHRDIGAGDLSHEIEDFAHGRAAGNDLPLGPDLLATRSVVLFDRRNAGTWHSTVPFIRRPVLSPSELLPNSMGSIKRLDGR